VVRKKFGVNGITTRLREGNLEIVRDGEREEKRHRDKGKETPGATDIYTTTHSRARGMRHVPGRKLHRTKEGGGIARKEWMKNVVGTKGRAAEKGRGGSATT